MKKAILPLIVLLVIFSCSKKEDTNHQSTPEQPHVNDTTMTVEKLLGKWEITYVSVDYITTGHESSREWIKDKGEIGYLGNTVKDWDASTDVSYINFNADHSYNHYQPNGEPNSYMLDYVLPPSGTWDLTDFQNLRLTTLVIDRLGAIDTAWNVVYKDSILSLGIEDKHVSATDSSTYRWIFLLERP